jgi:hypothetical protein
MNVLATRRVRCGRVAGCVGQLGDPGGPLVCRAGSAVDVGFAATEHPHFAVLEPRTPTDIRVLAVR